MRLPDEKTIVSLFHSRTADHGDDTAIWVKEKGAYTSQNWSDFGRRVRRTAAALVGLGVQPGDRVVQVSENRYEWIVCDLAIQMAQAVHVPVHAPLTGPQIVHQIVDCGARVVLVSTPAQLEKLISVENRLPERIRVVCYDACDASIRGRKVIQLDDLTANVASGIGREAERQALMSVRPDSLATILYTSGTTGEPKGVMLTQDNLAFNALATVKAIPHAPGDLRLCILPLSHIFARTCDLYTWIAAGSQLALAQSRETVLEDCAAVRPTLINGVPYFFERIVRRLDEQGKSGVPGALSDLLGGRIRFCCSGGAALPEHLYDAFAAQGVTLLQGYGLSETSPVITVSSPEQNRRGTAGRPLPGVEVRIAEDGEILTRGRHVMQGYYNNQAATDETIRDEWLYTGDLGQLDGDGFLRITGRKKEIIVTTGGKNISPVLIEGLMAQEPLIHQAMVVGDGRDYLAALVVPEPSALREEITSRRITVASVADALTHPDVVSLYAERIGQRLAELAPYEQVRTFRLIDRAFSIEQGELTPKLSLRREVIEQHFAGQIRAMYGAK